MSTNIKALRKCLYDSIDTSLDRITTYFKTGRGDYAEHDQFIGVRVPTLRMIAKQFSTLPQKEIHCLLSSHINEERLLALILLTHQYKKGSLEEKDRIYNFYIQNLSFINNWNLVDSSAHLIMGAHLWDKDKSYLIELASSSSLWERRIAIVSTWYFIRQKDLQWTFKIATLLLHDSHDLIHKAVGWMLREAGEKDHAPLMHFLDEHSHHMPRTMLRYAIEKLSEEQRQLYLRRKSDVFTLKDASGSVLQNPDL